MGIIDLHCDTLWAIEKKLKQGETASLLKNDLAVDLEKLINGNVMAQCFALFNIPQETAPLSAGLRMIKCLQDACEKTDKLKIVKKFSDFENNAKNGVVSAIITVEDGFIFENDLKNVDLLYDLGLKMVCLNHNVKNGIGNPNYGKYVDGRPDWITRNTTHGLTDFGFELVKKLNDLGIVIDLSHMSDAGFYDVIKASNKPIVASHSNAVGVCASLRNLTDDMLYKLTDNGGVTGICYANGFLSKDKEEGKKTLEYALKHIDYIKNLVGVDTIAIGSDFDGIPPEIDFKDCSYHNLLVEALDKNGYTTTEIEKITHLNALRVFKANMKE